jgi:diguanylate cyclase (GGDEF)-like protein
MQRPVLSALALTLAAISSPLMANPAAIQAQFDSRIAETKASMMTDPAVALAKARAAERVAETLPSAQSEMACATSQWLAGEALTRLGRPQDAAPVIAKALATVQRLQPGSKLHGDLVKSSAAVASKTGHVNTALPLFHRAFGIYQKLGEARSQAIILQNLGSLYYDARDYESVLRYHEQANAIFTGDPALTVSSHNNRGNAYKEMARFDDAEREYRLAIELARKMNSRFLEVGILANIASAQFQNGQLDRSGKTVSQGLGLATGSSQEWRSSLYGTGAQIAMVRGDATEALRLISMTFAGVDLETSNMTYRDFHEVASKIYAAKGLNDLAYRHLKAFKRLDDAGRDLAASTNSALMSARFDAANQQVRISKLEAQQIQRELKLRGVIQYSAIGGVAGALVLLAMMFAYASARRRREEVSKANVQLTYAANHDLLTGLANRSYYRKLVEESLSNATKAGQRCAILLVDLDHFKWVNDTLGHNAGDELLCAVARDLEDVGGNHAHAVRLGGDEFAVVVPNAGSDADLTVMANTIVSRLSGGQIIEGTHVNIGATVGIAVGPEDGGEIKSLTRSADLALYHGKGAGRRCSVRYQASMQLEIDERRLLERDLRVALERGQLHLAYQAIVNADSRDVVGYEALLRWEHPERGAISPTLFVPIAEEAGLINLIGDWVLKTACAEAMHWPDHINLSVNLSALQVEGNGLASSVVNALGNSGLPADRLELEVTESVFLRHGSKTDETLARLRGIGVRLSLDDFGTGYSSLGYLRRATFSNIKIDRSFVKSASQGSHDSLAIIKAIVSLADQLGMKTTAEGVETSAEMDKMRALGCTQLQGYLFAEPVLEPSRAQMEHQPIRRAAG